MPRRHSPEPWKIERTEQHGKIIVAANKLYVYAYSNYEIQGDEPRQADMPLDEGVLERIVACVNFCADITTDFLQQNRLEGMEYQLIRVKQVSDSSGDWSAKLEGGPDIPVNSLCDGTFPKDIGDEGSGGVWVNPKLLELLLKGKIPHARVFERDGHKYLHCSG